MRCYLAIVPALILAACEAPENRPSAPPLPEAESPVSVAGQESVIEIRAAWMRPHPAGRDVTAAYFTANLAEGFEDVLLSARIDGAERVELHGHFMTGDGVMQMREVGPQRIGEDGPLMFAPGGLHLMVFGLPAVSEGETVNGMLTFQNAGAVPVRLAVQSMPPELSAD